MGGPDEYIAWPANQCELKIIDCPCKGVPGEGDAKRKCVHDANVLGSNLAILLIIALEREVKVLMEQPGGWQSL